MDDDVDTAEPIARRRGWLLIRHPGNDSFQADSGDTKRSVEKPGACD